MRMAGDAVEFIAAAMNVCPAKRNPRLAGEPLVADTRYGSFFNDPYLSLLHVMRLIYVEDGGIKHAGEVRPSPGHPGSVDPQGRCPWPGSWIRHCPAPAAGLAGRCPGSSRIALSGPSSAGVPRTPGCRLEGDRDRPRGKVLSPDAQRPRSIGDGDGELAATGQSHWPGPRHGRRRDAMKTRAMNWWQRLWRRKEMDEQLEKELRFHLEQHVTELIAQGHMPGEANRLARIVLGGPQQVTEQCRDARGTRWLEDLLQDARYA